MACFANYYNSRGTEREMPSIPYGSTSFFQEQLGSSGMTPSMPTGVSSRPPTGATAPGAHAPAPAPAPMAPGAPGAPGAPAPSAMFTPTTVQNPYFTPGYLMNFIGRDVRVEFLIGTGGALVDRIGTLLEVGASYIVLRPTRTDDTLVCDLFSIKFVTVYG